MNRKQRKTFEQIFEDPVRSDILWSDIESLFRALGAIVSERSGSRIAVFLDDAVAIFHRPHPERITDRGAVKAVRKFLLKVKVKLS